MVDVAAKAAYVRTLLRDGASGLDEKDWETLCSRFQVMTVIDRARPSSRSGFEKSRRWIVSSFGRRDRHK